MGCRVEQVRSFQQQFGLICVLRLKTSDGSKFKSKMEVDLYL